MTNFLGISDRSVQTQVVTQTQQTEIFKANSDSAQKTQRCEPSRHRAPWPIWQITVPLGLVLIALIGSLTAHLMDEGRFVFDVNMSQDWIRMRADVDKRQN